MAVGIALAVQLVPPFGSAQAATPPATSAGTVRAVAPVTGVDLQATLTGPKVGVPGGTVTDSLLIANGGTDPATGVTFDVSAAPTGVTYVVTGSGVTCDDPVRHCVVASDLPAGTQLPVSLQVHTTSAVTDGTQVRPIVQVRTTATDVDPSNDTAAWATVFSVAGQLRVSVLRTSAATLLPGERAAFKITVTNTGPNAAIAPEVSAEPVRAPYSSKQVATASNGGTCSAEDTTGIWDCDWASIPAGESRVMTYAATSSVHLLSGPFSVTAYATADNSAPAASYAMATLLDNNKRATDLAVSMFSTAKVKAGQTGKWRVVLANHGPYRAHDVVFAVTLPKGFYWKGGTTKKASSSSRSRTATVHILRFESGDTVTLSGTFRYSMGTTLTWKATATHSDPDPKNANNTFTATTKVAGPVVATLPKPLKVNQTYTTTTTSSTSGATTSGALYDDSGTAIPGTTSSGSKNAAGKVLADTGGPALRLPLMGLTLVLLGAVSSVSSRQRRPAPRHRAWISPVA